MKLSLCAGITLCFFFTSMLFYYILFVYESGFFKEIALENIIFFKQRFFEQEFIEFNDIDTKSGSTTLKVANTATNITKQFENTLKSALLEAEKKKLTIVMWDPPFGAKSDLNPDKAKCGWCDVVFDRSRVSDEATRAIVFHFNELRLHLMPSQRRADQLYAWWSMESPLALRELRGMRLQEYNNVFNLTMTYRRDSDVYFPYGTSAEILTAFQSQSNDTNAAISELISKKSKLAFWVVSNCGITRGAKTRFVYAEKLWQAGLNLERKGGCFRGAGAAKREDSAMYKFYMAFENAIDCKDYITEKLFYNSLKMGTVPVVFGAPKSDYDAILPPQSFIYARSFKTPKDLADYLNYLDKNDSAYREYFEWRTMKVEDLPNYRRKTGFCQLCRVLHGINVDDIYNERSEELGSYIPLFGYPNKSRVVPSLRDWFYGTENRECLPTF